MQEPTSTPIAGLDIPEPLVPYMPLIVNIALALAIFVIGWMASKWARSLVLRALKKAKIDVALARFIASLAQYAVLAAALIAALGKVGVETTSLIAILGAAGLAVGLALQGSLSNFASGVMLLLFRPLDLKDRVTAAGHSGRVEDIGLFATRMQTNDNETIIIPNSEIIGGSIINYSRLGKIRANVSIGIAYGTDVPKAMEIMIAAAKTVDTAFEEPAPDVNFEGFGASSLDFTVRPWCTADDLPATLHKTRLALNQALEEAGIEIPFDQVVMHQAP